MTTEEMVADIGEGLHEIPLDWIRPTDQNPRHIPEDAPDLRDLAASIEQHGVLQPVVVRPHPDHEGLFDLRAGERRWRAAKIAGLETIPAIVRELDDSEALQITVTENLQREDLHPLEEARGIEFLLEGGWQVQDVAEHLGKSTRWVARRRCLTSLIDVWQEAAADPEHPVSQWPGGHLRELSKLEPEIQQKLFDGHMLITYRSIPTRAELRTQISRYLHEMDSAPWPLDGFWQTTVSKPVIPSCSQCEKRSSCRPLLFEELKDDEGEDRCLDDACWERHLVAWVIWRAAELYEEYGDELLLLNAWDDTLMPDADDLPCGTTQTDYNIRESARDAAGTRPALMVCGREMGQEKWVKVEGKGSTSTGGEMSWEEKRNRLTGRRAAHVLDALVEIIEESEAPADNSDQRLLRLACSFGVKTRMATSVYPDEFDDVYDRTERFDEMQEQPPEVAQRLVWEGIKPALTGALGYHTKTGCQRLLPRARRVCDLMSVSYEYLARQAHQEIPTPKSWPAEEDPDDFTSGLDPESGTD